MVVMDLQGNQGDIFNVSSAREESQGTNSLVSFDSLEPNNHL